ILLPFRKCTLYDNQCWSANQTAAVEPPHSSLYYRRTVYSSQCVARPGCQFDQGTLTAFWPGISCMSTAAWQLLRSMYACSEARYVGLDTTRGIYRRYVNGASSILLRILGTYLRATSVLGH